MDYEAVGMFYAAGSLFWCFLMSAMGERVDKQYFASAALWPFMAMHMAGAIFHRLFKKVFP